MNPFSWPAETWYFWLSLAAVVLVGASVITSLGALAASRVVNRQQAEKMVALETNLANAQRDAADAELTLRKRIERNEMPRWAFAEHLDKFLAGKPTGVVEILYVPESDEAQKTASWLWSDFDSSGWKVLTQPPQPITNNASLVLPRYTTPTMRKMDFPLLTKVGGMGGVTVVMSPLDMTESPKLPKKEGSPMTALYSALWAAGYEAAFTVDERLPEGHARIIVGPRHWPRQ